MRRSILLGSLLALALVPRPSAGQSDPPPTPPQEDLTSVAEVSRMLAGVDARLRMGADEDGALVLERLRLLYFLSVADEAFLPVAVEQIEDLEGRWIEDRDGARRDGSEVAEILDAFRGALEVVRGKHAFWPHQKVAHVRTGLADLDRVVQARPDLVEARYLRLLSSFYLPFFFGRGDSVESDMGALANLLVERPRRMSEAAYRAIIDFVVDHGELDEERRDRLVAAAGQTPEGRPSS